MSTRTIADIDADIAAVKHANPNWLENVGHTALITAYINEKNKLSALAPADNLAALYLYSCNLNNARRKKCFKGQIFASAEECLAHVRVGDGYGDGILDGEGFEIRIKLVFKEESWMLKFQSAILSLVAYTSSSKKPKYAEELKNSGDDTTESLYEVLISDEAIESFPQTLALPLKRVVKYDYQHFYDVNKTNNSPDCDIFADSVSMSSLFVETVSITSAERRIQMIENYSHEFFHGKNAEVAHIKDKAKCSSYEEKDVNNQLYLSRHVHEAFDGINTVPTKTPWFAIHVLSYDENKVDCPKIGPDAIVESPFIKRQRCNVLICFYNESYAADYAKYLRNDSTQLDATTYCMDLYFEDAKKAKYYFDWKEKKTRLKWEGRN